LPPLSESHGFDKPLLDAGYQVQLLLEERQDGSKILGGLIIENDRPVDLAELAEDARLPFSVTGPRDFAPLAR
jgi:hypothetical protein